MRWVAPALMRCGGIYWIIIIGICALVAWLILVLLPYAAGNVIKASKGSRYTTCVFSPRGSTLESTNCLPGERRVINVGEQEVAIHIDHYPHNVYCENVFFALNVGVPVQLRVTAYATARTPHDIIGYYGLRSANLQEVLAFSAQNALSTARQQINLYILAKQIPDTATLKTRLLDLLKDQPEEAVISGIDFEWSAL